MVFALILAGGVGSRMGETEKPKQYLEIGGKPILQHTVERFLGQEDIDGIYVLCPAVWVDYTKKLLGGFLLSAADRQGKMPNSNGIEVLGGGNTRNETIMCGIRQIEQQYGLNEDTLIVTHDAARPFVTRRILSENIAAARRDGAATTAIPATDTILSCPDGRSVSQIPDRSVLYQCQTPQTFHAKQLKCVYETLSKEEKEILTDASKILLLKGFSVSLVRGERSNIKITYPEDLQMAEAFCSAEKEFAKEDGRIAEQWEGIEDEDI